MIVTVFHGLEQDLAYISRLLLVIITLLNDSIKKFATHHFFSDKIVKLRFLEDIVESDYVLMLKLR